MGTPCSKCRPRPPGPVDDFSTAIQRPHGGQHRPAYPGPRPGPILHHCTPSGKWRRPEGSYDTDPASGWTSNPPGEGVSVTDPAPGWAIHSPRRQIGYLPTSYMTPTAAWWNDLLARPSPPRHGLIRPLSAASEESLMDAGRGRAVARALRVSSSVQVGTALRE